MIEIIRLLVVWMYMRALDEAAFVNTLPVRECQWVIFNRAIECRSPGAMTTLLSASNRNIVSPAGPESLLENPDASTKQFLSGRAKSVMELFGQIPGRYIHMRIRAKWVPIG